MIERGKLHVANVGWVAVSVPVGWSAVWARQCIQNEA